MLHSVFFISEAQKPASPKNSSSSSEVILLVTPFDKDSLDELNPVFQWVTSGAATIHISDGAPIQIQYKFTLVKINPGQAPNEAIQKNQPLHIVFPLQGNMLQYPVTSPALEKGGHYAWKVEKFLNGALYNQSETWEFRIKVKPKKVVYDLETMSGTGGIAMVTDDLFIGFTVTNNPDLVSIMIKSDRNKDITSSVSIENTSSLDELKLYKPGANTIKIDCSTLMKGNYKLELSNANATKQTLFFQKD